MVCCGASTWSKLARTGAHRISDSYHSVNPLEIVLIRACLYQYGPDACAGFTLNPAHGFTIERRYSFPARYPAAGYTILSRSTIQDCHQ